MSQVGDDTEAAEQIAAVQVAAVQLGEAERRRLIELAADVLGRLPADQVPGSLRAFARFTPAKRARLGAAPLAAAVDGDDAFRAAVAEAVEQATPELVQQLRDGAPTGASDPVDVAVVAYLVRPDGWADIVAAAAERGDRQRDQDAGAAAELARIRDQLAQARAELRAQAGRQRAAEQAAAAEVAAELAEVRKQLRHTTSQLRTVTRERDDARAEALAAAETAAVAASGHDADVRRLRNRITELERTLSTARRESRRDRELDHARLGLLLDTLVDAAGGLRRELSLPPSRIRPADTVEGVAGADGGARTAADAPSLERFLALPQVHLLIDGYNVTKTGYPDLPLADQRARLVTALAALAGRTGVEVTVAFDGANRPPSQPPSPRGVRVLFSAPDQIADDLIRDLVEAEPPGRPLIVVTSDQEIVQDVRRAGAYTAPSAVLLAALG